jgi:hypothetical protein
VGRAVSTAADLLALAALALGLALLLRAKV